MSQTVDDLVSQAQSLPDADRALLVERLLLTLHDYQTEVEEAWKVEIERRIDDIDAGRVTTVPWEEAKKTLGL